MSDLVADKFINDKRVQEAQSNLIEILKEHSAQITQVTAPKKDCEDLVRDFSQTRGVNLFFPYIGSGIGNGPLVELKDGSIKYDFISGIGVHHCGHSHPEVIQAAIQGALEDTVMQGNLQQTEASYRVCKKLVEAAQINGSEIKHCFLTSSGVMSGENALKLAFQKHPDANRVLAFKKCFAGRTITFSQITDKSAYRQGIPLNLPVDYIPFYDENDPEASTQAAEHALKEFIYRYPGKYAGMFFELIQGEGGYFPGTHDFHSRLMKICKDNNIAVLVDEVQTFARTSHLYAFQEFGLDEYVDIVWIGKASQVCATLFTEEYRPKPGLISQTFTSCSSAITAGEKIIDILLNDGYLGKEGKINLLSNYFKKGLQALSEKHPTLLSGPFGYGLMNAFTAYGGDADRSLKYVKKLFDNGLMSFTAGANPTRVRFLIPALATEPYHIDNALTIIEETLSQC